jgi:hypothetical protein
MGAMDKRIELAENMKNPENYIKFDALVNSCHSRESGNPGTCKYLK